MTLLVSVILPTHAPDAGRLAKTLHGLKAQTLPPERWQLLIIDNASPGAAVFGTLYLAWHRHAQIIREPKLGLTYARLAGIRAATGQFFVFVDDDNVLAPDYLEQAVSIMERHPGLGAIGGKSIPEWETQPPSWFSEFLGCLAVRNLGDKALLTPGGKVASYPPFAPIGAGMALRRQAAVHYGNALERGGLALVLDRCGGSLSSGGDNDIVLTILAAGWQVGYFPELSLTHLIPNSRLSQAYLARLNHDSSRSWIEVLDRHGIRPWPAIMRWTVLPRKLRAFWRYRAWRDPASYVRWRGACGIFDGRARLLGR